MFILITYDVCTSDSAGRKRLRRVAKLCVNYGVRVQNSVFECKLDAAQCRTLQAKLISLMDEATDSLRFYYLGNKYESKIEHFGCKETYMPDDPMII
jgi:CRISPR-associated protein Cas2